MTTTNTDKTADSAELVARAAALRPLLQEHADETDRLRRLADANVAALQQTGLCRLMVPKRFGGYQTNIHTYMAVMAELAAAAAQRPGLRACSTSARGSLRSFPNVPRAIYGATIPTRG